MISDVGARSNRVSQLRQGADDQILTLRSSLSGVENIDLPKTITELQMQQVAYEAALGATAKAIQPSLLDFLR
jgi:flagellar hook-associated protein 3 FlgL